MQTQKTPKLKRKLANKSSMATTPVPKFIISDLPKFHDDPELFARKIFNMKPTEQQCQFFDAVKAGCQADGKKRISVRSGHGIGKTAMLAIIVIWFTMTRKTCETIITAVNEDQIKDQIWREIGIWKDRAIEPIKSSIVIDSTSAHRIDNLTGATIRMRVARKERSESMSGYHAEHLLAIADEASGIDDVFDEVVDGWMTRPDNWIIKTGNPTRRSGHFRRDFYENRARHSCLNFSSLDSPLVNPDFAPGIASKYGINSNVYRVRVLGEFPTQDADTLIPLEWVEAAMCRDLPADQPMIIGVDPGRSLGGDATGLIARAGQRIIAMRQFWIDDVIQVAERARQFRDETMQANLSLSFSHFAVDTIGLGAGVADYLKSVNEKVKDVNVGQAPTYTVRHEGQPMPNMLRDELWIAVREWLQEEVCISSHELSDVLTAELTSPKYGMTPKGNLQVEAKDAMKRRGISSPNLADALCLTFYRAPVFEGSFANRRERQPGCFGLPGFDSTNERPDSPGSLPGFS